MHKLFQFEELDCVIYIFLPLNPVNKEMTQTIKDELHKGEFSQNSLVIKQGCSTSVALICFVLDHSCVRTELGVAGCLAVPLASTDKRGVSNPQRVVITKYVSCLRITDIKQ